MQDASNKIQEVPQVKREKRRIEYTQAFAKRVKEE